MEELVTNHVGALVVDRVYTYGLDLISQYKYETGPGSPYWDISYYGYDGHGNVRFLTDSDGNITDTYDYDAFGTLIGRQVLDPSIGLVPVDASNESLVTQNNYLYCGEQFDPDLGLYFLRARYMDTDRGRFWTMDVWEGLGYDPVSLHKYLYANADPISFVDPLGYFNIKQVLIASLISAELLIALAVNIRIAGCSILALTPPGTTITIVGLNYWDLAPEARAIVDIHEGIHSDQQFWWALGSRTDSEIEAYRAQFSAAEAALETLLPASKAYIDVFILMRDAEEMLEHYGASP